jgi:hypothetical protein
MLKVRVKRPSYLPKEKGSEIPRLQRRDESLAVLLPNGEVAMTLEWVIIILVIIDIIVSTRRD